MQAEAKNLVSEERTLVSGMIESWDSSAAFPLAQIRSSLGQAGCLATESEVHSQCFRHGDLVGASKFLCECMDVDFWHRQAIMHMETVTDEPFSDAVIL